jgi:hypothetical protein
MYPSQEEVIRMEQKQNSTIYSPQETQLKYKDSLD